MGTSSSYWLVLGLIGQGIFTGRFLLQWLYSEYKRRSAVPISFWYASIVGGVMLLIYAIHKQDPVFMTGSVGGLAIYMRNLLLRLRQARDTTQSSSN